MKELRPLYMYRHEKSEKLDAASRFLSCLNLIQVNAVRLDKKLINK